MHTVRRDDVPRPPARCALGAVRGVMAKDLLFSIIMQIRQSISALAVALLLIPFALFALLLLLPTGLLLLPVVPALAIGALLVLVWRAPVEVPGSAHPHAISRTGTYPT